MVRNLINQNVVVFYHLLQWFRSENVFAPKFWFLGHFKNIKDSKPRKGWNKFTWTIWADLSLKLWSWRQATPYMNQVKNFLEFTSPLLCCNLSRGGSRESLRGVPSCNKLIFVFGVFVKSPFIPKRKKSKRRKKSETDASKDDQAGVNRHLPTPPGEEPLQPASTRWNQVPMCQVWCTRWNQMTLTHLPMRNMLAASMLCFMLPVLILDLVLISLFQFCRFNSQLSRGWNIWKCSSRQSTWLYHQSPQLNNNLKIPTYYLFMQRL